ncbi:(2Fe-2S)-binding protein [Virgibacillus natechei]
MLMIEHPVLGKKVEEEITFYFNGQSLKARQGQTVAAALIANGIKKFGVSRKLFKARGLYCANGRCCSCFVTINGLEHSISCNRIVEEGMIVASTDGDPVIRSEIDGN